MTENQLAQTQTQINTQIFEYNKLKHDLLDISKYSTKRVIVPLCSGDEPIAFFTEGQLKHTNEILVSLGSHYYCERTSHECAEIIDRRIEKLEIRYKDICEEIEKLKVEPGSQKESKDSVRLNEEGLLEIEEVYEEPQVKAKKVASVPGIQYVDDDPFSAARPVKQFDRRVKTSVPSSQAND